MLLCWYKNAKLIIKRTILLIKQKNVAQSRLYNINAKRSLMRKFSKRIKILHNLIVLSKKFFFLLRPL